MFTSFSKQTALSKVVSLLLAVLMMVAMIPTFVSVNDRVVAATATSVYNFEDIEYNHTPEFPCVADSTVVVYPDPVNANNKALLVDSASTAAKATYYFTDISTTFEISVDVYVPTLSNWQIGLFPDQIDGRIQFAVTGDASGNLMATSNTVSTYKAAEWFNVKIVADPVNEVADVYLNGNVIATDVAYYGSGVGYGYSGGVYLSSKDKVSELYFDNLVTPLHDEVHVEKYVPEYIQTQILSSATPDQCGHDPNNDLYYNAFPSLQKVSDEKVIIVFHRGVKHAYSHGVLDCIVYNPKTEEVVSQTTLYDDPDYNAQNADIMTCPNGDLLITLNEQYPNDAADPYESLVFRSTDQGETWVKSQQPTDQFGHHYDVVYDYVNVGSDMYMLAYKGPELNNNDSSLDYMCLVKSSDNGYTWTFIKNLEEELKYKFNESTIELYGDDTLLFFGRGDKKVTKAALIDLEGNVIKTRNMGVDFDCIDHNGKSEIIVKDGEYYIIMRSIPEDVGNAMELPLFRIDPETLNIETYVELQPKNTGTNGGDGFYAEAFFQEKNGEEYFNVVTYTRNPNNNGAGGVPSIVRFEYEWDEIKDPVKKDPTTLDDVAEISKDISELNRKEIVTLTFDKESYNYGQLGGTTNQGVPGIAGATADGSTDRVMSRGEGVDGSGAIKWATSPSAGTAVVFGKENLSNTGLGAAYELVPGRSYKVTYQFYIGAVENVTFGLMGVASFDKTATDNAYVITSHNASEVTSSGYVTYTEEFTVPAAATLGDNKYLSFYIKNANADPTTTTVTALLDDVSISADVQATTDDVITFNDNGKIYYANADVITFLPAGNNGLLDCKFEAWVNESGAVVTTVPSNGTVLTAKYPVSETLPTTKTTTVSTGFDRLLTYKNISGNANGVSGIIVGTPGSTVYSRSFGGNYAIKANGGNTKQTVGLYLARDDNAYTGDQYGYIFSPNTDYTISFDECVSALTEGTTVTVKVVGVRSSSTAVIASGIQFGETITITEAGSVYTNHTVSFTTPSIAELGKNARLELVVECTGTADTYSYSIFVDNVSISETVELDVSLEGPVLYECGGDYYFYNDGVLDASTQFVEIDSTLYYVENGKLTKGSQIVYDGETAYYVVNGIVKDATVSTTGDCVYILDGTTLLISGTGAMADYSATQPAPWGTEVTEVIISDGVTAIGSYAFSDCSFITELTLPTSVVSIGDNAFAGCDSLETVNYDGYVYEKLAINLGSGNEALSNANWNLIKDRVSKVLASSIRKESGAGETYKSAGVRFRARLDANAAAAASEIGFVIVPKGYATDSAFAVKAVNKSADKNLIYTQTDSYVDYQVIMTGLTKEGRDVNLCGVSLDVYFYYVVNGQTVYCGETYNDSYNEIVKRINGVNDNESSIDSDKWWDFAN